MYKIIASDMDETFLGRDHAIPPANLEALRRMRELGVAFVPSSGRPYDSVWRSCTPEVRELIKGSYVISLNGACINRAGIDEPLTSHGMASELIEELFRIGHDYDVAIHVYEMSGRTWGWNVKDEDRRVMESLLDFRMLERDGLDELAGVPLAKILYDRKDLPYLHRIADEIAERHPELVAQCEITYSSARFLEFCPKGVDKATGIHDLCNILGIETSQVIAMGDSLNDLPMIKAAGLGVAVANATDGIDEYAGYVTEADCDAGALAEVVDRFL